jgi:hypothetical protein
MVRILVISVLVASTRHAAAGGGPVLRVANWNVINQPNADESRQHMGTILEATGRLDVLALVETDRDSARETVDLSDDANSGSSYRLVESSDAGNDRVAVVYDAASLEVLDVQELSSGLTHHSMRVDLQPLGLDGAERLTVYAIQLKSGYTDSNQAI